MEGAAVGLVSLRFNKPFLVIRIASDLANEYAEVDFEKFCKYVAPISAEIITHLLKYLPGGRK
jgi:nucleoside phosphorylase